MNITAAEIIERLRVLATPIDFDALIRDEILKARSGGWYEILDGKRLPPEVTAKAYAAKSDGTRTCLKFSKGKSAARMYSRLTSKKTEGEK